MKKGDFIKDPKKLYLISSELQQKEKRIIKALKPKDMQHHLNALNNVNALLNKN